MNKKTIVEVQGLKKYFPIKKGLFDRKRKFVKAVDDISFSIIEGETLGLVGESGCGKTTVGRTLLKLYNPTDGKIFFKRNEIQSLNDQEMIPFRKKMQMIFQDPYSSLDPRMTISDIIMEPMNIQNLHKPNERQAIVIELLNKVGLQSDHLNRYPHEFSGGQRQRVGIARALAMNPEFIVCDEPISALDVSIQAQIVNMLENLQKELGLTYLFISHDLTMVRHLSHKVGVMYLGVLVEYADTDTLYKNMLHPYTQALFSSTPVIEDAFQSRTTRIVLKGEVPSAIDSPEGCVFSGRCPKVQAICREIRPRLIKKEKGHYVACHLIPKGNNK